VRFDAVAGTTYHIMVGSLATGTRGTLRLNVTPAPPRALNDDEPTVISSLPFSETVDVSEATASSTDPDCEQSGHTVWYSYTPADDIRLEVDTSASNWDTVVAVYEGDDLNPVICTDSPVARFDAKAGATYRVMIGSWYDGPSTVLVVSVDEAPPALQVAARIADQGRISKLTGAARLKVRVRCSVEANAYVSGHVKQRQGDRIITGSFSKDLECGTAWTDARMTANPDRRAFRAGKAVVRLSASAWNSEEWTSVSKRKVVRFR
jgi:translation initiation factor IF-1